MSFELLTQLEAKVATTLDSLEILRMEMDEIKEENTALKNEKQAWEARLGQLLGKFSELEPGATATDKATEEKDEAQDLDTQDPSQDQDQEQNQDQDQNQDQEKEANQVNSGVSQDDDLLDLEP